MAEAESVDPIARESTTTNCVCMMDGQTSYDPKFIAEEIGGDGRLAVYALSPLFGVPRDRWPHLDPDERRLVEEASPINFLTKHAPPGTWFAGLYRLGFCNRWFRLRVNAALSRP